MPTLPRRQRSFSIGPRLTFAALVSYGILMAAGTVIPASADAAPDPTPAVPPSTTPTTTLAPPGTASAANSTVSATTTTLVPVPVTLTPAQAQQMDALQQQVTQTGAVLDQLAETYEAATEKLTSLQQDEATVAAKVALTERHLARTRVRLRAEALISYMGDVSATETNTLFNPGTAEATKEYEQVALGNTSAAISAFEIESSSLATEETSLQATETQITADLDQIATARQTAMIAASTQQAALAALSAGNDPVTPAYLAAQSSGRDALVADRSEASSLPHALVFAMWAAGSQVGVPYVWGGETPLPGPGAGFDCSGLVQWAYGQAGITLPRTAEEQHGAVTPVPADQAQPGDLVFWNDGTTSVQHVAIYVGAGVVLQAPSTGSVVSYAALSSNGLVGFGAPKVPTS